MQEALSNVTESPGGAPSIDPPSFFPLIILGGGPAGLTAAIYARRAGVPVLLLEHTLPGGQMNTTPEVENYPGFERISGFELGDAMRRQALALGTELRSAAVTALDLSGAQPVVHTAKESLVCDALILAMGATRRLLDVEGEARFTGRGVSYCATCDGSFFRGKTVAVVGGGNTALEDALYLAGLCREVVLIHRRDEFRGEAYLEKEVRQNASITLRLSETVTAIEGGQRVEQLRLRHAVTGDESVLPVDAVFVAVGTLPQTALLRGQLALDAGGYVPAGEDTKTGHPAIFAAGDLRQKELRQIITAAADGAVAATHAAKVCKSKGL